MESKLHLKSQFNKNKHKMSKTDVAAYLAVFCFYFSTNTGLHIAKVRKCKLTINIQMLVCSTDVIIL